MVEADEGDLDSDQSSDSDKKATTDEDQQFSSAGDEEHKADRDINSSQFSESDQGFLDDVFNQLGGFDVGDYGDEIDVDFDIGSK